MRFEDIKDPNHKDNFISGLYRRHLLRTRPLAKRGCFTPEEFLCLGGFDFASGALVCLAILIAEQVLGVVLSAQAGAAVIGVGALTAVRCIIAIAAVIAASVLAAIVFMYMQRYMDARRSMTGIDMFQNETERILIALLDILANTEICSLWLGSDGEKDSGAMRSSFTQKADDYAYAVWISGVDVLDYGKKDFVLPTEYFRPDTFRKVDLEKVLTEMGAAFRVFVKRIEAKRLKGGDADEAEPAVQTDWEILNSQTADFLTGVLEIPAKRLLLYSIVEYIKGTVKEIYRDFTPQANFFCASEMMNHFRIGVEGLASELETAAKMERDEIDYESDGMITDEDDPASIESLREMNAELLASDIIDLFALAAMMYEVTGLYKETVQKKHMLRFMWLS